MLQLLRNKAQSIVIQAVVVIIALVFIFWGVGTNLMNSREAAIVINGEEITFQDFQIEYDRAFNSMRNQFGGNIPQGLLENLGIKDQVVNQLIQETLLRQGAAEMGINVSREDIRTVVEGMVQFHENGVFDLEKYKSLLAVNGFTPTKFEQSVAYDSLTQKASLAIGGFASNATDFEIEDLHKLDKSTINIGYVKFSPADYVKDIINSDEEIEKWFPTVQDKYKTDPQVKLKYLDFSYANIGEKISIDEQAITSYYTENVDEFTEPEQRKARHILFKADENSPEDVHEKQQQKATEILDLARQGDDFAELAKRFSEGPTKSTGGDLGFFPKGRMVKPFEDAVFSLDKGAISDVVKTPFGYHIIKVEDIQTSRVKPQEQVASDIENKLQNEQAKPLAFQVANEAYEEIIGAGSLANYLQDNPTAPLVETDFFSKKNPPASLEKDAQFLAAAFALKANELSSLIETANGYAILFAEAIKEPQVPSLTEVIEEVKKDFVNTKSKEAAESAAQSLLATAKETQSLVEAAENYSYEELQDLKKSGNEGITFPQLLISDAFKLSADSSLPEEVGKSGNDIYVYQFLERKEPQDTLTEEDKERYRGAIVQLKQQQVISAWIKNKQSQAKIFRHKNL